MQFEFELSIGENKFVIKESAESHADFFEKVSFFSSLPKEGPNGEKDLKLVHRVAQGKYNYYSIVCESAKKEFKLGQLNTEPGKLFPKGWEDLFEGQQSQQQSAPVSGGLGAPTPTQAPVQQQAAPNVGLGAQPTPTPAPAMNAPQVGQGVAQAPQVASQPQAPASQANSAVNDILKQYGVR